MQMKAVCIKLESENGIICIGCVVIVNYKQIVMYRKMHLEDMIKPWGRPQLIELGLKRALSVHAGREKLIQEMNDDRQ